MLLLIACASGLAATPALADYTIDVGDTLDFAVAGVPTLVRRLTVDIDGEVSFPLAGRIKVAGRTAADVQAQVRKIVPTKSLNLRYPEGADTVTVIDPEEIAVSIAEYRPVYVNGDVGKPGELPFRPGMTVHQAIALASGYDILRFRMDNPFIGSADYRADYTNLWSDYARTMARIARIKTEMGEKKGISRDDLGSIPIPAVAAIEIIDLENRKLQERTVSYERDKAVQQRLLKAANDRLTFLTDRQKTEQQSAEIDRSETERLSDLNSRGVVPITRLVDQRRLSLISANGALEVGARTEQTRSDREQAQRGLEAIDEKRRLDLLNELQDATQSLATTRAKLQSVSEKLLYSSTVRSKLTRGPGGVPTIFVSRKTPNGVNRMKADDNTVLQPGDVIEVSLNIELDTMPPQ